MVAALLIAAVEVASFLLLRACACKLDPCSLAVILLLGVVGAQAAWPPEKAVRTSSAEGDANARLQLLVSAPDSACYKTRVYCGPRHSTVRDLQAFVRREVPTISFGTRRRPADWYLSINGKRATNPRSSLTSFHVGDHTIVEVLRRTRGGAPKPRGDEEFSDIPAEGGGCVGPGET